MWKITSFNEQHHIIFFSYLDQQEVAVIKKVKIIAFYSLFALRRSAQKLTRSAFPVTKNENI